MGRGMITKTLKELSNDQGLVLAWIDPDKEPTKHLINDLYKLKSNFENWNGKLIFFIPTDKLSAEFNPDIYKNLPQNSLFAADKSGILSFIKKGLKSELNNNYPVVLITDSRGNVIYTSSGYKIGSGEQILNTINPKCKIH